MFLDEEVLAAELLSRAEVRVSPAELRRAQGPAKRHYEALLEAGGSHDDGWFVHMEGLLAAAGIDPVRAPSVARAVRRAHDEFNLWRRVPEGLADDLRVAKDAGLRLGVISNSEGAIAELLEKVGLGGLFEVVVDSGVEGIAKPDPEIFRRTLERMNVAANEALYVGDVPSVDVDGARGVGMGGVLIDAFDHYPDYDDAPTIHRVSELLAAWFPGLLPR